MSTSTAGEESPDGPFAARRAASSAVPPGSSSCPVGASEDRLIGSLDLQEVLAHGRGSVQPGLLAAAHRGVLYVDEVNLLHDHLVDLLLDAAATGRSHVERDGVSFAHPARFLLVGTMNPEEGELRPQLLDRFGLTVAVAASREVAERTEVVRRRLAHDADPDGFAARFAGAEDELRPRASRRPARGSARWRCPTPSCVRISAVCAAVEVDGMRADVVLARTAVAHAAWRGADAVDADDVRGAARLALPHRRRRDPFDEPHLGRGRARRGPQQADQAAGLRRRAAPDPPRGRRPRRRPDDAGPTTAAGRTATVPTAEAGRPAVPTTAGRRRAGPARRTTAARSSGRRPGAVDDADACHGDRRRLARRRATSRRRARSARRRRRGCGRGASRCTASARARPAAARAPAATRPHGAGRRRDARAGPALHLPATVLAPRPARGPPGRPAPDDLRARRSARAARATSCCSAWTPPARWPRASG